MISIIVWITSFLLRQSPGIGRRVVLAALGLLAIAASVAFGQVPTQSAPTPAPVSSPNTSPAYVPTMTFDVASVRVASESNLNIRMGGQFTPHTTNLRLTWTIDSLLNIAYGVNRFQLVGVPNWTTVFAIEAKSDAEADAKIVALPPDEQWLEQQHMLQALLADASN